ncbi:hypothetical protein MSAN_01552600 [Mycena sanguinolenta]|uniref:F-box domain-containing protein n=1 Tax=Mycena sanguinolenta TaxID=230812 RepID=A0A8H6Y3V7_9AGAR|nr:hypothetical protein MSAN_01552600 [Mycena sanguinolenta]
MLVCKTITEELRHLHASGNTTYELDVDNVENQARGSISKTVAWRRIPCPPSSVRTLQANVALDVGTRFWGCGGPMPILSQLYQILNSFIHNGPLLVRGNPLSKSIHLDILIVQVCAKEPDVEEERANERNPRSYDLAKLNKYGKRYHRILAGYISQLVQRGLLYGAVDKIVCRSAEGEFDDDDEVTEWQVSFKEIRDMSEWEQYDFGWGVPGSKSSGRRGQSLAKTSSSQSTMPLRSPGFFLSLPAELRLQIYDAVASLPLDCQVVRSIRNQQPEQRPSPSSLPISWLNLMLVCKTITDELQHHVHASGNTTYELELDNLHERYSMTNEVTWRQIPCPPSSVRTLKANLVLRLGTAFGADGGHLPILSDLYQVLNCFIHNGPLLARATPLVKHIHLSTLIVQIRVNEPNPEERRAAGFKPYEKSTVDASNKWLRRILEGYISMVVRRGLLFGAVDKILCRWADGQVVGDDKVTEWEVSFKEIGDMTVWNKNNFGWGVPGSSSLVEQPSQSDASI